MLRLVYKLVLLLVLSGVTLSTYAQQLSSRRYSVLDGLHQTEVHGAAMMHDTTLFIWENNHKMSSFDGYQFEQLDSITYSTYIFGAVHYLKNGSVLKDVKWRYYNGVTAKEIDFTYDKETQRVFVNRDTLFALTSNGMVYNYEESTNHWYKYQTLNTGFLELQKKYGTNFWYNKYQNYEYAKILNQETFASYHLVNGKVIKQNNDGERLMLNGFELEDLNDLSKSQVETLIKSPKIPILYGQSVDQSFRNLVLHCNNNDDILVSVENNAIEKLGKVNDDHPFVFAINKQCILLSSHNGLQKINPRILYFDSNEPLMVSSLHTIFEDKDSNIWFGGYGSGLSSWDGVKLKKPFKFADLRVLPGANLDKYGDNYIFCEASQGGLKTLQNGHLIDLTIEVGKLNATGYLIKQLKNGSTAFGLSKFGLGLIKDTSRIDVNKMQYYGKDEGIEITNVISLEEDNNGRIWLGNPGQGIGLVDLKREIGHTWKINTQDQSIGAMSMELDVLDNLWIGTAKGLYFLKNPDQIELGDSNLFSKTEHITLPNGDNSLVTFMKQVDQYLVLGNASGVSFVDLNSFYKDRTHPIIYQLLYGEDLQGGGSEQNAILFDSQRRLWIGSQDGASMIKWDDFEFDHSINEIKLKSVVIGDDEVSLGKDNEIILPVDNRNCTITFGPRKNPSLMKNIFFDYHLVNGQGDTLSSVYYDQEGVFDRPYMEPGSYELIINAKKHGQLMDAEKITINAPLSLSENPWFWSGLGALIFGSLFTFIGYRNRQRRLRMEKDLELSELRNQQENLQIQAIISSFNPHFINNSLHWVQSRHRKDETTVKVIGRLSENISSIFLNTRKGKAYHNLEEELRIVENYVEIQNVRFKNTINYIRPSGVELKELSAFPVILLQLQIHVENAIEHGLRNREEGSFVKLIVKEDEKMVYFSIEDDGVGRKGAEKMASGGTQMGTKMLHELHEIFNKNNKLQIVEYYDDDIFTSKQGLKYGTRVNIEIPKIYNYDL